MSQNMTAAEFRAELKRLDLGQSAFAAVADVPLRTVQSWALGERSIPRTGRALIEKVERMPTKNRLVSMVKLLPKEKLKPLINLAELLNNKDEQIQSLTARIAKLEALHSKSDSENKQLKDINRHQAAKIEAYDREARRRAAVVVPFNSK